MKRKNTMDGYWQGFTDAKKEAFHDACGYIQTRIRQMIDDGKNSDEILQFIMRNHESIRMRELHLASFRSASNA